MNTLYRILNKAIADYGTRRVLEELINNYYDDVDYIRQLKEDLQKALDNYEARYEQ